VTQPYPGYDVLAKWDSPSFDATTRAVLHRRLNEVPARRFFTPEEFGRLEALARALLALEPTDATPIAAWIDADLYDDRGEGFRAPQVSRPQEVWRSGLAAIEAEAGRRYLRAFVALDRPSQAATLAAVQADSATTLCGGLSGKAFFETVLLKAVAGHYYSHPTAWNEIGFGGPASPRGYVRTGIGERDPWEAAQRDGDR